MDWTGLERLASTKDQLGIWIWAHERHAGGAEKVLSELRAEPDPFDDDDYGIGGI